MSLKFSGDRERQTPRREGYWGLLRKNKETNNDNIEKTYIKVSKVKRRGKRRTLKRLMNTYDVKRKIRN